MPISLPGAQRAPAARASARGTGPPSGAGRRRPGRRATSAPASGGRRSPSTAPRREPSRSRYVQRRMRRYPSGARSRGPAAHGHPDRPGATAIGTADQDLDAAPPRRRPGLSWRLVGPASRHHAQRGHDHRLPGHLRRRPASRSRAYWVLASLVFVAAGLVDSLDGLLARYQGRVTAFGAFLDSTLDRLAEGVILGAIGITFAQDGNDWGARRLLRRPDGARSSSPTPGPGPRASASPASSARAHGPARAARHRRRRPSSWQRRAT